MENKTQGFSSSRQRQRQVLIQEGHANPLTGFIKPNQNLLL